MMRELLNNGRLRKMKINLRKLRFIIENLLVHLWLEIHDAARNKIV